MNEGFFLPPLSTAMGLFWNCVTLSGGSQSRGRSLKVMAGSGWMAKWPKSGPDAQPHETEQGLFWATLELLTMVVVDAHGGGGVGGCYREQVVALGGRKSLGEPVEKSPSIEEASVRLIVKGGWDAILRAFLAHLK